MNSRIQLISLLSLISFGLYAEYNPFVDGAAADVRVCVVDDRGAPVSGARVSLVFLTDIQKVDVAKGLTDSNGHFNAVRNCIGEMRICVQKDGYYETSRQSVREFRKLDGTAVIQQRRWADATVTIPIQLKKIRNPVRLKSNAVQYRGFPATNEVLRLDLERLDWCPPYGHGKHDDLHLTFDGRSNTDGHGGFFGHLKVDAPHCADGFYSARVDSFSSFKYAYAASTNSVYRKTVELRHAYEYGKGVVESKKLAAGEYLIYRIRSQTNELGEVTHAHYGLIGEGFRQVLGLTMRSVFNPTDNDTNLEGK